MMSFTGDGQLEPSALAARDRDLGVDTGGRLWRLVVVGWLVGWSVVRCLAQVDGP